MKHAHILLAVLLAACGGSDGGECTEGAMRCQARRFINTCINGSWTVDKDCATEQASCIVDGGTATCQVGGDADTDSDTDIDTGTYPDIDTDTLDQNCSTDADCTAALGVGHCCSLSVYNAGGPLCTPEDTIHCRSTVGQTCPNHNYDQECRGKDSTWCIWRWDMNKGELWNMCSVNCAVDAECEAAIGPGSCCAFMPEDNVGWVCYPAHSVDC